MADTCLASIRKCVDPDGPTRAFEPPPIVRKKVKFDPKFYGLERAWALRQKAMADLSPGEKKSSINVAPSAMAREIRRNSIKSNGWALPKACSACGPE